MNAATAVHDARDAALLALLGGLEARGYAFVTPTPATHARVVGRPGRERAATVADVFGWSLPFAAGVLDDDLGSLARAAGILVPAGEGLERSTLRVSALHGRLFLHSAYPTSERDAVFLGPDSYRFADLIAAELAECPPAARIVDIGTGAGVGGIVAAGSCPEATVTLTDINPAALRLARINAIHNRIEATCLLSDKLEGVPPGIDVVLANPPYIIDPDGREYRDGGALHGGQISLDMAVAAAERLAPGGRLILYTGSAIIDGEDRLRNALASALALRGCSLRYREIDPDVFGEELDGPAYADVDRIALVGAIATRGG
ncbi:MAG: methyltransferase [Sphingomonas bacterium]|nr:class I SAM-dependent methyltransferase [Sphingomonas bacterium]MDB5690826.1 methyltransferase [Sphingomonas bacterium]